jgi:hypothetical protein
MPPSTGLTERTDSRVRRAAASLLPTRARAQIESSLRALPNRVPDAYADRPGQGVYRSILAFLPLSKP